MGAYVSLGEMGTEIDPVEWSYHHGHGDLVGFGVPAAIDRGRGAAGAVVHYALRVVGAPAVVRIVAVNDRSTGEYGSVQLLRRQWHRVGMVLWYASTHSLWSEGQTVRL